jgi:hypothetical protein
MVDLSPAGFLPSRFSFDSVKMRDSRSAHFRWPSSLAISSLRISIITQARPRDRAWRSSVK